MEIHINQLPTQSNYVILDKKFNDTLLYKLLEVSGTIANASRLTGISKSVLGRFFRRERDRIRVDFLLKIASSLNINLKEIENNAIWIGANNSQGIINPKLPFKFNSRKSARFLAAICNDGWISEGVYYSNSSQVLRNSVKSDALSVFGGNGDTIREWIKEKDQYLSFPSIIRDVLVVITQFRGVKSENNPPIPSFILQNKNLMLGWIEQTIADEGFVKYYPETYRREINWRRSFNKNFKKYKLILDETKMLSNLGIIYSLDKVDTYKTKSNVIKVRLQIRITRKENLLKLRRFIIIPDKKKDRVFTEMLSLYDKRKKRLFKTTNNLN